MFMCFNIEKLIAMMTLSQCKQAMFNKTNYLEWKRFDYWLANDQINKKFAIVCLFVLFWTQQESMS